MTTHNLIENGAEAIETGPDDTGVDVGVIGVTPSHTATSPQRTRAHAGDRSAWPAMEDYAALVRDRTPLRAGCLPLARGGTDTVAARIAALPARVSAVFIVGTDAAESACVQFKAASRGARW